VEVRAERGIDPAPGVSASSPDNTVDGNGLLGEVEKADVLAQMRPHIFFDDQLQHLERARERTPSAQVLAPGVQVELDMYPTKVPANAASSHPDREPSGESGASPPQAASE
jgi:hypothetical protein